ncbi:MAG: glycosyltransferase family 9 protein [Bacteroidota bacterium]
MGKELRHFLVIRLSAMGDVVLAAQVIRQVLMQHPNIVLHMVTRPAYQAFFQGVERIQFITPDLYGKHKGLTGLYRLAREIQKEQPVEGVIDLHDVLRSIILRQSLSLHGIKTASINKDRKARKSLTQKEHKDRTPLTSIIDRMAEVFQQLALPIQVDTRVAHASDYPFSFPLPEGIRIGIAPSASTQEKTYPPHLMREVVMQLLAKGYHIFALGGGKADQETFVDWQTLAHNDHLHDGMKYALPEQLGLMAKLDLMLTMDSSNMHMARLLGIPVLSIWGATHPAGGYAPFGVEDERMFIQMPVEEITCRPCSIFGNKACFRERMYCMEGISPDEVVHRIDQYVRS